MVMFVTMMIVMVMGNLLIQTEAQAQAQPSPFKTCYPGCVLTCFYQHKFPKFLLCPFTCLGTCLFPHPSQMVSTNEINHTP
ncbi:hypothetical protein ARALYDRAFT_471418 [Arabidopsis lyrata subsp. lyrata]|uniref:Uncharacterized protein n=1 Tax=Arabidopsis lyrata subsp. lyrata TaxID=81972 RepID=D7KPA3_ARALL|nr:hypothetical protein ARALYDRAFT_471418 [Arabidopsis lyrata subsp. lyrata]